MNLALRLRHYSRDARKTDTGAGGGSGSGAQRADEAATGGADAGVRAGGNGEAAAGVRGAEGPR